jgi:hypothetical protein
MNRVFEHFREFQFFSGTMNFRACKVTKIDITARTQGDQMSFRKNRPKYVNPNPFLTKSIHNVFRGNKQTKNVGFFCNLKKTAQSKHRRRGENSPNLVTLLVLQAPNSCIGNI